jgi:hypothetical protein
MGEHGNLPRSHRDAWCSFCGKCFREVGPLYEGTDKRESGKSVYICRSCVELAASVLDQEAKRKQRSGPIEKELIVRVDLEPDDIDAILESVKSSAIRLCEKEKQSDADREGIARLYAVQNKLRHARAHGPTSVDRIAAALKRLVKRPRT